MVKRNQSVSWVIPGTIAVTLILLLIGLSFCQLISYAVDPESDSVSFLAEPYFWRIVTFTLYQAGLSTLLSVFGAILLANAFRHRYFIGRRWLLRLYSVTFILPSLVIILGIINIYGREGFVVTALENWGISASFSLYGMTGILIAHVFYNLPFAFRVFLQALEGIPTQHHQLSAQLGFTRWQHAYFIEFPVILRTLMPVSTLIFTLCFTSFTVVLTLGGGPQFATVEVAIYQSIRDFEWTQSVTMSLIQCMICMLFLITIRKISVKITASNYHSASGFIRLKTRLETICDWVIILISFLFIAPPIFSIIIDGIRYFQWNFLANRALWQAAWTSLWIALCSGIYCLILTCLLLWSSRHSELIGRPRLAHSFIFCGTLILVVPGMILASGFFLLFQSMSDLTFLLPIFVIVTNALMAMPYALRILERPMTDSAHQYFALSQIVSLNGLSRFYWVDYRALQQPIRLAFAFACLISLGDFGIIALFGDDQFMTLPYYLYQQIAAYRSHDSTFTGFLLLLLSLLLFAFMDKNHEKTAD